MARSEVGTAYVAIMPSMDKFNEAIRNALKGIKADIPPELNPETSEKSGTDAGRKMGSGFADAVKNALSNSKLGTAFAGVTDMLKKTIGRVLEEHPWLNVGVQAMKAVGQGFVAGSKAIVKVGYNMAKGFVSAFANVGAQICRHIVSGVQQAYSQVASIMSKIGNIQVSNAANSLGLSIGKGVTGGLTSAKVAIGGIISNMISTAANTVTSSVSSAIQRLDIIKNFPKTMSQLGVGTDMAEESINELSNAIDGLPTSLDGIVGFTQKIFPAFDGDLKQATKSAVAFNNALVAGGADTVKQANALEQWSQMMANGKVDMQSWRSVIEAMPAQMNQVAKAMGKTNPTELYNSLIGSKNGTIPLEELNEAFLKLNEEGLDGFASFAEQAQTAAGGIGTAITNVSNRINKALASVMDWVGQENIAGAINSISSQFGPFADKFVSFLESVNAKAHLSTMLTMFGDAIGTIVQKSQPLQQALKPLLDNALPAALQVISSTLDTIISRAEPFFQSAGDFLNHIGESIGGLEGVQDIIDAFVNAKFDTWEAALSMWQDVIAAAAPEMPKIIEAQAKVNVSVAGLVGNLSGKVAPIVSDLWVTVSDMIAKGAPFVETIVDVLAPVFTTIYEQIENIYNTIIESFNLLSDEDLQSITDNLSATMQTVGESVAHIIQTLMPYLPVVVDAINRIVQALAPAVTGIIDTVAPYIPQIAELFAGAAEKLAPALQLAFERFFTEDRMNTISELVNKVVKFISEHLPDMADILGNIVDLVFPIIGDVIDLVDAWLPEIIGLIDIITNSLQWLYDHTLKPIFDLAEDIGEMFQSWDNFSAEFTGNELVPSVKPFASGGIVNGPTKALIGEAGYPEAVVPLTATGIEKFTSGLSIEQAPSAPNITVRIDNFINQDTGADVRTLSNEIGRQTMRELKMQGVY